MSARTERMKRKARSGGVVALADVPGAKIKTGAPLVVDGALLYELEDGRLARAPFPRLDWRVENGRVVRDGARVHAGKVVPS